jgi:hypothetical protein
MELLKLVSYSPFFLRHAHSPAEVADSGLSTTAAIDAVVPA